jgi:hypothetical protein
MQKYFIVFILFLVGCPNNSKKAISSPGKKKIIKKTLSKKTTKKLFLQPLKQVQSPHFRTLSGKWSLKKKNVINKQAILFNT